MKANLVCFINVCIYAVLYHFFHKQRMRLITYLYQREILHFKILEHPKYFHQVSVQMKY